MSSTVRLKPKRVIIIITVMGIMTVLAIRFGVGTAITSETKRRSRGCDDHGDHVIETAITWRATRSSPGFIVSASPASAGIAATSGLRRKRRLTIAAVAACLEAGPGVHLRWIMQKDLNGQDIYLMM